MKRKIQILGNVFIKFNIQKHTNIKMCLYNKETYLVL
jgi:hypothetical protein